MQPWQGVLDEVLVIAGDKKRSLTRHQVLQRLGRVAQFRHGIVDQVTDDGDQIGLGLVDHPHDALGVAPAQ